LAGPVFAAAVILPQGLMIDGLNDSKKMTEKKREELFEVIQKEAIGYSIAFATEQEIDEINILQATFLAMRRAYEGLNVPVDYVLVDGNRMPDLGGVAGEPVVKGDAQSANIAAASILAKVSRGLWRRLISYIRNINLQSIKVMVPNYIENCFCNMVCVPYIEEVL